MSKLYLAIFGDKGPQKDMTLTKYRLAKQADETGWFDGIFTYDRNDIQITNNEAGETGFGWWRFKHQIVKLTFDKIEYGDIVLYLDAGCSLNKGGEKRFLEYVEICKSGAGFLGFEIGNTLEKTHTKRDLFLFMNCDSLKYTHTFQIAGGIFFIRKNKFGKDLIEEFGYLCGIDHLVNNAPSVEKNYGGFKQHSNDQSILSLIVKKNIPAEGQHLIKGPELNNYYTKEYMSHPIKVSRIKDGMFNNPGAIR